MLTRWWRAHGTKILGWAGGTIQSALLIEGLIPDAHFKYYQFAALVLCGLTVRRGHTNSKQEQKS
jgi:hypothetical protein